MNKTICTAVVVFASLLSIQAGNERLIGTWKSNRDATLSYLKTHTKLTPEQLAKVSTILGKMVLVFDSQTVTEQSGDHKFTSKYKIVEETKDTITFESIDSQSKKPTRNKLELDGKGFWSPDERIAGYKERFDKVAKEQR
jgi:hypothetical protein